MSRKQAYVYFYASYCGKTHHLHDSDIFRLKIKILDKNNLFATLELAKRTFKAPNNSIIGSMNNSTTPLSAIYIHLVHTEHKPPNQTPGTPCSTLWTHNIKLTTPHAKGYQNFNEYCSHTHFINKTI